MLKGLGNLANLGSMMKQAQEMGSKMQEIQEQLKSQKTTGGAGGGMVEIDVNGAGEALAVRIEESLFKSGDREMIEDLITAAINAAQAKAKQLHADAMKEVTAGMNLPGLDQALGELTGDDK